MRTALEWASSWNGSLLEPFPTQIKRPEDTSYNKSQQSYLSEKKKGVTSQTDSPVTAALKKLENKFSFGGWEA